MNRNRSHLLRSFTRRRLASCVLVGAVVVGAADSVSRKADDVIVSDRFARHIEGLEGFKAKAYRDTAGKMTIGFGHLIKNSEPELRTAVLTRDEALAILRADVAEAERAVNRLVKVKLRQEQFDALVSFTFNIGQGALSTSTLLRKLNDGHCCAVPDEMRKWKRGGNASLLSRRNAEIALYVGEV